MATTHDLFAECPVSSDMDFGVGVIYTVDAQLNEFYIDSSIITAPELVFTRGTYEYVFYVTQTQTSVFYR